MPSSDRIVEAAAPPAVTADPVIRRPGEGRHYDMGALRAVFKADAQETAGAFSISEWWLESRHEGPGAHRHDANVEIFFVMEGEASILVGEEWHRLAAGSVCVIPRGVLHDFRNESTRRMGLLNIFLPGSFEEMMPKIVQWYRENPARPLD
jgi:mannose-6-phosphate isomerase-like protein (cupin superfamily)